MSLSRPIDRGTTGDSGFVDKRITQATVASVLSGDYRSVTALRTALQAADAGTYTDVYISHMTKNDQVYALRTLVDSAGIK